MKTIDEMKKRVASYHRTVCDYVNSFVKACFKIQEMQEPRPLEEGLKFEELKNLKCGAIIQYIYSLN